jgi:hypothetical protein
MIYAHVIVALACHTDSQHQLRHRDGHRILPIRSVAASRAQGRCIGH